MGCTRIRRWQRIQSKTPDPLEFPRTPPKGFADEVAHVHKEIVPTDKVSNGNYAPSAATKLNDAGVPTSDPREAHIPGGH
jgi:hypothetical protein